MAVLYADTEKELGDILVRGPGLLDSALDMADAESEMTGSPPDIMDNRAD